MVFEIYSAAEFERRGHDSPAAAELARSLEQAIADELLPVVRAEVERIVAHLNAMGHQLKPSEHVVPMEGITFKDDGEEGDLYWRRLLVAMDLVISAGYSHLVSDEGDDDA